MDSINFYEDTSVYKNNSALIGGVIYCTKCSMETIENSFTYNIATEGGVIYIESDASLYSNRDTFQYNTALSYAGAMFITTRSIF